MVPLTCARDLVLAQNTTLTAGLESAKFWKVLITPLYLPFCAPVVRCYQLRPKPRPASLNPELQPARHDFFDHFAFWLRSVFAHQHEWLTQQQPRSDAQSDSDDECDETSPAPRFQTTCSAGRRGATTAARRDTSGRRLARRGDATVLWATTRSDDHASSSRRRRPPPRRSASRLTSVRFVPQLTALRPLRELALDTLSAHAELIPTDASTRSTRRRRRRRAVDHGEKARRPSHANRAHAWRRATWS